VIEYAALGGAFIAGLAGSGHCVAMCGPISTALGRGCGSACAGSLTKNLSRISGYALMGALVGGIGNAALLATQALAFRSTAQTISGVLMLLIGLGLLIDRRAFAILEKPARWLTPIIVRLRAHLPRRSGVGRDVAAGLLWSLLPCGMVYAALTAAWLSADWRQGALLMACFGLGTLPALLGVDWGLARARQTPRWRYVAGAAALALGGISIAWAQNDQLQRVGSWVGGCIAAW
jgi:uncharacterized protein